MKNYQIMTENSKLGNGGMDTVPDGAQTRRKRLSTSGTFSENISKDTVCKITKDAFKKMSTDEKLVSLFGIHD